MKSILLLISLFFILSCSDDDKSTTEPTDNEPQFCSDIDLMPEGLEGTYVRIVGVLPNPDGDDDYNEKFRVKSFVDSIQNISLYYILDDENVRWNLNELDFSIDYSENSDNCRAITYTSDKVAQLLNSGDTIYLYDKDDRLIQTVVFGETDNGQWVDLMTIDEALSAK